MLKAEDLEQQQPEEKNLAAIVETTTVENIATNDRGEPQSPPSYSLPAPSRSYFLPSTKI